MQQSGIPTKFPVVWASGAGGSYIRTVPNPSQIGITNGAASFTDGFPPLNFQAVGSGGYPPAGQDFNGALNAITAWNQWQQAGASVQYDSGFSTSIGGYPKGAVLQSTSNAQLFWLNIADNNTTNPDSGGVNWVAMGPAAFVSKLTSSPTYYVNASTGNDSNNGLTSGTAFATLQKAANTAISLNLNGFNVGITVANGTYATVNLPTINGSGIITFTGNTGSPSSCIIQNASGSAITAGSSGATWVFNGFQLQSSGASSSDAGCALAAVGNSTINLNNIVFGTCQGGHISAVNGAVVTLGGNLTISGGLTANALLNGVHLYCGGSAIIQSAGWATGTGRPPLTISTAVSLPYFVAASSNALVEVLYASITNPGNVTGQRYSVILNAIVNTSGAGSSYYPGTIAGTTGTGGQYA